MNNFFDAYSQYQIPFYQVLSTYFLSFKGVRDSLVGNLCFFKEEKGLNLDSHGKKGIQFLGTMAESLYDKDIISFTSFFWYFFISIGSIGLHTFVS